MEAYRDAKRVAQTLAQEYSGLDEAAAETLARSHFRQDDGSKWSPRALSLCLLDTDAQQARQEELLAYWTAKVASVGPAHSAKISAYLPLLRAEWPNSELVAKGRTVLAAVALRASREIMLEFITHNHLSKIHTEASNALVRIGILEGQRADLVKLCGAEMPALFEGDVDGLVAAASLQNSFGQAHDEPEAQDEEKPRRGLAAWLKRSA